ncbi:hypothetical protein GCM10008023_26580 [Sphingomonas glacialis]|uniref:Glycosyl transferase family 1 domain-containing protein n=2 Tax=Sphingomonas glacialis TaxID=658225 RepID=A0ABQ3LNF0_9SPHN|nr:hypothetical protein GCM10008023_26580 [Sphingomonas glacialis]
MADPHGRTVSPVRYERGAFRHTAWPPADTADNALMVPRGGDVFLGLDLSFDAIRRQANYFIRQRRAGIKFWFVVYDLLPIQSPEYFSSKVAVRFRWWLAATAKIADGYICISPHVADEVGRLLADRFGLDGEIAVKVVPMGIDLMPPTLSHSDRQDPSFGIGDFVLAVGTVEPRKGYDLLLDAFERLWDEGSPLTFLIVGSAGWKTEALQRRIRRDKEFGNRLRWLTSVDDEGLALLYDRARALVAASHGEGFGLPILEAVARSCPVLARDIPAFRVHSALGLRFFSRTADGNEVAEAISLIPKKREAFSPGEFPTWRDTADAMQRILSRD